MSSLRDAFDEIVADVPVYGDLDRAIERAAQERRRRHGAIAGLAAAAAVLVVVAGLVAAQHDADTAPPVSPTPTPTPTTKKSQSTETWADTAVDPEKGYGWDVPNPLTAVRAAWIPVVAEHLDPQGTHLQPQDFGGFAWSEEGAPYSSHGVIELLADRGPFEEGCHYLGAPPGSTGLESCTTEPVAGPHGERVRISRYQRLCATWDPGQPGDDARPGPGNTYETCGDFRVAAAVERRDGLIGYLVVDGRGTLDHNPVREEAMVAAAADARIALPETAFAVPSGQVAASVASDHFPRFRAHDETSLPPVTPGTTTVSGTLGDSGFSVSVWPAGGDPVCGRSWLVECVERHVFGDDDPTTVFVGAWDEHDWAGCCPRNSRAYSRQLVYVGPHNTVSVSVFRIVRQHEDGIGPELDRRVIGLLLDPRLQDGPAGATP